MGLDNPLHIALVLVVVLLLFGARRLPEIGRSLGTGIREFKHSVTGEGDQTALGAGGQQQEPVAGATPATSAPASEPSPAEPVAASQAESGDTRAA